MFHLLFTLPVCDCNASDRDVHTEHCCVRHGCKYGDDDCTVVTGRKVQSYPCETCDYVKELADAELKELKAASDEHLMAIIDILQDILISRYFERTAHDRL